MARKCLADKISALITTTADFSSDDEPEETKAKVVERYDENDDSDDEFQQSKIRKQNIDILDQVDKRYAGKKVLRKDIYSEEDDTSEAMESDDSEEDEEDEEMENILEQSDDELDDSEEIGSQQSKDAEDTKSISDDEDKDDYNMNNSLREKFTIQTMSETNVKEEIEKGNCVRNQLKIWENILEMRIKLQKCIVTSNQMPQYDTHEKFRADANFVKKINETKAKLSQALNNMLQLKDLLLKQYPTTMNLCSSSKKRKIEEDGHEDNPMDEEIPSDEDELGNEKESPANEDAKEEPPRKLPRYDDYEKILRENHTSYVQYRDTVIKQWNDKTRIATSTSKDSSQPTLKRIEFAMSNMNKLRKKTQLKRSEYYILGKPMPIEDNVDNRMQEYDPEIFDDDDFYHQLLRNLIESKVSDTTDPALLTNQWRQLQNVRSKMKKKIDTRASKGRKVRYTPHDKIVNFFPPITMYNTWTDSTNELCNSLFGKIKSIKEQTK